VGISGPFLFELPVVVETQKDGAEQDDANEREWNRQGSSRVANQAAFITGAVLSIDGDRLAGGAS